MLASDRAQLRRKLDKLSWDVNELRKQLPPRAGWLSAVREALGLSASQVAKRLAVATGTVFRAERREALGTITIATAHQMARAMGCHFVWFVVPDGHPTLEAMVDARAHALALRMLKRTDTSMGLENQVVSSDESEAQLREVASSLKNALAPSFWIDP